MFTLDNKSIKIAELPAFPAKSNPFNHDAYHMGTPIGNNCYIMHSCHTTEECEYLIIINTTTGERLKVLLNGTKVDQDAGITNIVNAANGI